MLKLPKTLPPLGEPHFILANPVWRQIGVLVVFSLLLPLAGLMWIGALAIDSRAESGHWALAGIAVLALSASLLPRNWRRWVNFAADCSGIYIGDWRGQYHFVPWSNVGRAESGIAGVGSNRQNTVILWLKIDDDRWAELLGGRKRRVNAPADAQGFRPFGIGNASRSVEETLRRIESLRSGHVALR